MWYKEGIHLQIAIVYTITSTAGGPYTGSSYAAGPVGINNASDLVSSYDLYPNPAADNITMDFTLTENKTVNVQILNTLGQQMDISQSVDAMQGANTLQLNISSLTEGIYFVQIKLKEGLITKRFIVSK